MAPASDDLWNYHYMPLFTEFKILMPNGTFLNLELGREDSLKNVKSLIWTRAKTEPLFSLLKSQSDYVFVGVNADAQKEEFHDENRRLCDLRLFSPTLRLVVPKAIPSEAITQSKISQAIGKPVQEFDLSKDLEFGECRRSFLVLSHQIVNERRQSSDDARLLYYFSPDIDTNETSTVRAASSEETSPLPPPAISKEDVHCQIFLDPLPPPGEGNGEYMPNDSIHIVFKAGLSVSEAIEKLREQRTLPPRIILKVCGFEEYLIGNYKLYQYKLISTAICHKNTVQLAICLESNILALLRDSVDHFIEPQSIFKRLYTEHMEVDRNRHKKLKEELDRNNIKLLWQIEGSFKVRINMATYVNVKELDNLIVCVGLYHGTVALCPSCETPETLAQNPAWHTQLEFGINIEDLPRSTILCLSLCNPVLSKKEKQSIPIAYGNIPVFDYTGRLFTGKLNMNLWRIPKDHHGSTLHPLGIIGLNPERDALGVEIEFDRYAQPVYFPFDDTIKTLAQHQLELELRGSGNTGAQKERRIQDPNEVQKNELEQLTKRDALYTLNESEKNLLWRSRSYCHRYLPDSLPKLLESVCWNCREEVAQIYLYLDSWPLVQVGTALVLLDCKFTDLKVRSFAIQCLEKTLPFHTSKEYLLQLVQVVLHELYLNTDTSRFLLTRALRYRAFGHQFFWLLKTEIDRLPHARMSSLLLEAYCRGIGSVQLDSLLTQSEAIGKLTLINDALMGEKRDLSAEKKLSYLRETLKQVDFAKALQNIPNPVRPKITLGELIVEKCNIMDSAKRPLKIVWKNGDITTHLLDQKSLKTHELIFKHGDDLRQDMLSLQVIRIMDSIWRSESLDLKMMPYSCLVTGRQAGLIEVVKAETVMGIQRNLGPRAAFQIGPRELHKYFETNSKEQYARMMDNFTRTCAGYSMVTLVLGIGDRNPDNIMINDDGQIFHIDFGHFLGHFKKKFGINRERVPFVLPDDFLYVISRGQEMDDSPEMKDFYELCRSAYMILRKHSNLLITLFMLMLSTGMPELQTYEDIGFLRTALQCNESDEKATEYIKEQWSNAKTNSTYTKIDWFFHQMRR